MMIIGVDYHPGFQQIAFLVEETGEWGERRLDHSGGEAENFYRDLKARGISVRVGLETTGYSRWQASLGRHGKASKETNEDHSFGVRTGVFKKDLTEPTLLEISGNQIRHY